MMERCSTLASFCGSSYHIFSSETTDADGLKHNCDEFLRMMEWLQFLLIAVYGNFTFAYHRELWMQFLLVIVYIFPVPFSILVYRRHIQCVDMIFYEKCARIIFYLLCSILRHNIQVHDVRNFPTIIIGNYWFRLQLGHRKDEFVVVDVMIFLFSFNFRSDDVHCCILFCLSWTTKWASFNILYYSWKTTKNWWKLTAMLSSSLYHGL